MLSLISQYRHELSHRGRRIPSMAELNNKEEAEEDPKEDALLAKVSMMDIAFFNH